MKKEQTRTLVLTALVVLVGVLVVADRLGAASDDDTPTPRDEHARHAEVVARMRAEIVSEPAWRDAVSEANDTWAGVGARLIHAPTAELATARLGQLVRTVVTDLGVTLDATSAPSVRTPADGSPVRIIALSLSLRASSPEQLHLLVDRLENLPGAWTNIAGLRVQGPRRVPTSGLNVDLDLEALAWVGDRGTP